MKLAPIPTTFTSTMAKRDLVFFTDRKRTRTRIRIGRPKRDVPTVSGMDWRCPISISGQTAKLLQGFGVDSLQALVNALQLLELEVSSLEKGRLAHFEWLDMASHGLPRIRMPALRKQKQPNKPLQPTRRTAPRG